MSTHCQYNYTFLICSGQLFLVLTAVKLTPKMLDVNSDRLLS